MIIVHGTFPVKAESRDDALALMRQMALASRAEQGCISYEFYVGLTDPNTIPNTMWSQPKEKNPWGASVANPPAIFLPSPEMNTSILPDLNKKPDWYESLFGE